MYLTLKRSSTIWQGVYELFECTDVFGQNEPFKVGDLIITRNYPNKGEWTLSEVKGKTKTR